GGVPATGRAANARSAARRYRHGRSGDGRGARGARHAPPQAHGNTRLRQVGHDDRAPRGHATGGEPVNIPNHRDTAVRVFVDRYGLSQLTDTDGAPLVDTDGARLLALNLVPIEITDRVRSGRVSLGDVSAIGSSHAGVDATVAVLN